MYDFVCVEVVEGMTDLVAHVTDLQFGQRFLQVHHDAVQGASLAELNVQLQKNLFDSFCYNFKQF